MKYFVLFVFVLSVLFGGFASEALAQNTFSLRGKVIEKSSNKPIGFATVVLKEINKWGVTNVKGEFHISKIEKGTYTMLVSCLGYKAVEREIVITKDLLDFIVGMEVQSLGLAEVTVTAKQSKEEITSSYDISSTAIEHAQLSNISGIMALLPGGQTRSDNLSSSGGYRITLRGDQSEADDPDYGTAIEIDGIRLSSNANFGGLKGVDPRIISPENIEKVEVVTGIPSVEHGDLTSGMVKIITKQGVMPFTAKVSSSPRQKQVSLSKGVKLGKNAGVLNFSYDYTKATKNIASPYTSYTRNAFTLRHKKIFFSDTDTSKPLTLSSTIAGNIGGYDTKADPDQFKDTYEKKKAFNIRGGIDLAWQVNSKLISQLNFAANINYTDNKKEEYDSFSSASGKLAFHGTKEGYYVAEPYKVGEVLSPIQLLKRGYWYQTEYTDSKPLNYSLKLKMQKNISKNKITSKFKLGADFTGSGNEGKGEYYGNRAYTPTWREHRYSDDPYLNNFAVYAEESFKYRFNKEQSLQITGGLRNNYTFVKDSKYGNVNALSPRFKLKHTIINNADNKFLKELSWYAGWGKSVKLPSFGTLYTVPSYRQRLAFVPGSLADGTTYYAYHIQPMEVLKNESLKWQKNRKLEIGVQGKIKGIRFSLVYFNSLATDIYFSKKVYSPYTHYITNTDQLGGVSIPYPNRAYTISSEGTVTIHDKTGVLPNKILDKEAKETFKSASYADNGSPVKRQGIEWVLDLGKIKPIHTSLRIDGKYYYYKYVNKKMTQKSLGDQLMTDRRKYRYIGYYYGGNKSANGKETHRLSANATLITHIPKLRLVVSLRVEGTFINSSQNLSEMPSGDRSFTIDDVGQTLASNSNGDIYSGDKFVAMYPLYYTTFDDMNTKIPFREKYLWAYENDKALFNDLSKMVVTSNRDYYFKKRAYTPYFSSNINVSKEIGEHFKLTFYANNFLNNMAKVKRNDNNVESTLLNSKLITPFYYGMSLKIKL